MDNDNARLTAWTRRELLQKTGAGIGSLALAWLLRQDADAGPPSLADPLAPKTPHFPKRATRMIQLHMVGAPSHLDLFEYKKTLQDHDGKLCPKHYLDGQQFAFLRGHPRLLGTRFKFKPHGQSGILLSELLPHLSSVVDEIAMIKTMQTDVFNHAPAQLFMHTGFERFGRPSLGSWLSYGLGSVNQSLPAYVVMITGQVAGGGNALWGSGFLPSVYQGVEFRSKGDPVLFLSNPRGISAKDRRRIIDSIQHLNRRQLEDVGDPEIATRISQYEMAFRMQSSVPELMDLSKEPQHVLDMYGATPGKASFANNCLLARRLVERGVRFVQLFDQGWDHHGSIFQNLPKKCKTVDKPIAALIKDLKQRGLLDETLVAWGSEFGRTPMLQGQNGDGVKTNAGRDHHKDAFCSWLAGGGVKGGTVVGETDDLGYSPTKDPVHVHDLNATILRLMGIDHERLTFSFQGRPFRLTDVYGNVVQSLLG